MFTFILLLLSFLVAKAALLAIVLGTTFLPNLSIPFISTAVWPLGYDSSSTVLLPEDASKLGRIAAALFRWDSVYFISLADRAEYLWEQEWAFGPGWPMLIRYTAPLLKPYLSSDLEPTQLLIVAAVILSNLLHLLALVPLYSLTKRLYLNRSLAIITCILHSFSPAGAFLFAGNTESLFNFLSFSGMALFHKDYRLLPALIWSLAGTVRSNAILWTGFFAWDALNTLLSLDRRRIPAAIGRLIYLSVCAFISIGGFLYWQYLAWNQYCTSSTSQEWCSTRIPMIYSHVQNKYWDVGFLRYWTANQLPNFLIASPHILCSIFAVSQHLRNKHSYYTILSNPLTPHILALAGMTFLLVTSMHVQIATRVLTAFPALYWYVAGKVMDDVQGVWVERTRFWEGGVRAIVVFGCVGAVLYSAFLPPA